jgi:hypothetical protein
VTTGTAMRFTKRAVFIAVGGILCLTVISAVCLFWDAFYGSNFRSMQDKIWSTQQVNLTGLRDLRASGGTSVRFLDLQRRLSGIKGPKIIVDGMAEDHGYIKGIPTTFFGYQREGNLHLKHLLRRWIVTGTFGMLPNLVVPELQTAKDYGFGYKKVNIGSKFIETDTNIDEIVEFYKSVPPDAWLHFHCAHGKGRTSILLVMLDIFKNAPAVALEDIVKRQYLLGSEDLFNLEVWKKGTYDRKTLEARKKFIQEFYEFVCQLKAGGIQRWSEWRRYRQQAI